MYLCMYVCLYDAYVLLFCVFRAEKEYTHIQNNGSINSISSCPVTCFTMT